jgi:GT2 family glycosyltransferase
VVNALPRNPYSTASQLLVDYLARYYNRRPDDAAFATSNNLAFPTALYHQCGGFDPSFPLPAAEDRELCDRWRSLGLRVVGVPEAIVAHDHALGPGAFWRQHFNYGRGAVSFHRARRRRGDGRVQVEPVEFYRRMLLEPFARERPPRAAALAGLLLLSQVAHLAGYVRGLAPVVGRRAQGTGSGTA